MFLALRTAQRGAPFLGGFVQAAGSIPGSTLGIDATDLSVNAIFSTRLPQSTPAAPTKRALNPR